MNPAPGIQALRQLVEYGWFAKRELPDGPRKVQQYYPVQPPTKADLEDFVGLVHRAARFCDGVQLRVTRGSGAESVMYEVHEV